MNLAAEGRTDLVIQSYNVGDIGKTRLDKYQYTQESCTTEQRRRPFAYSG